MIYIQDEWRRQGEMRPAGDHIDIGNGYRASSTWLLGWFSWRGREVWFWEVK